MSRGRVARNLVIGLIGVVAVGAAVTIGFRRPIAESLLLFQLRQISNESGAVDVELRASVVEVELDRFQLRDLQIGSALQVARFEARYSPAVLLAGRVDSIHISGLRLNGRLDEAGISFGPLDALLGTQRAPAETEGPEPPASGLAFPTALIEIDDARIELATPQGPLVASIESNLAQPGVGQLDADARFSLEHALGSATAALAAHLQDGGWLGDLSIEAALSGEFGSMLPAAELELTAHPSFEIAGDRVVIRMPDCAALRVERLKLPGGQHLARPLVVCAKAESISIDPDRAVTANAIATIEPFSVDLGEDLRVSGRLPVLKAKLTRGIDGQTSGVVSAESAQLDEPVKIGASGIEMKGTDRAIAVTIERVSDGETPARFGPMGIAAKISNPDSADDASAPSPIGFELEIANPTREFVATASGEHEIETGSGSASVQIRPFAFCPGGAELSLVWPGVKDIATQVRGVIGATGSVAWSPDSFSGSVDLALRDVAATLPAFDVEKVYAAVTISESGTEPGQLLSVGKIDFGLQLTGGEIVFQILESGVLAIESSVFGFAGGELSSSGQLDPTADEQSIAFDIRGVDIATLTEIVALDGLSGTGTLDGRLPIHRIGERVEIEKAKLAARAGGGTIRYRPDGGAAHVGATDDQFGTLMRILEDFTYTDLTLSINGEAAGDVEVAIHLEGSNPSFEAGHPVNFNFKVEARLSDLISSENSAYQIPHLIEERLREFSGGKVNIPPTPCVHSDQAVDGSATQR